MKIIKRTLFDCCVPRHFNVVIINTCHKEVVNQKKKMEMLLYLMFDQWHSKDSLYFQPNNEAICMISCILWFQIRISIYKSKFSTHRPHFLSMILNIFWIDCKITVFFLHKSTLNIMIECYIRFVKMWKMNIKKDN